MFGKSSVNVKFEPRSTFTFTRNLSYIVSTLFTRVRTKKVHDNGNSPIVNFLIVDLTMPRLVLLYKRLQFLEDSGTFCNRNRFAL